MGKFEPFSMERDPILAMFTIPSWFPKWLMGYLIRIVKAQIYVFGLYPDDQPIAAALLKAEGGEEGGPRVLAFYEPFRKPQALPEPMESQVDFEHLWERGPGNEQPPEGTSGTVL